MSDTPKMQMVDDGDIQGAWLDADGYDYGLIAKDGTTAVPYVQLQRKRAPYPIALSLDEGEPILQVPCKSHMVHVVKVSKILEFLELLEAKPK